MNPVTTGLLRVVIVLLVLGALLTQLVVLPDMAWTLQASYPEAAALRVPTLVVSAIGLVPLQAVLVCVWRLVGMARRDAVFSPSAFRWVDSMTWSAVVAAAVAVGLLVWLLVQTRDTGVPPGIFLTLVGCAVLAVGVALLVVVLRGLLVKAVAWKGEATALRAELAEVI
ncbi:DUF2975 domain-containing protein [Promicromonospora sp. NPDC059942]|uniref:DUF2975 domain-containing protein n=1 Tax=Promicromonospora sp. NPDC059942 TaxID=3347009 RepID=UPI00365E5485